MNVLNIEHVSKIFGDKKIFDDISYGIHDGDKIGIIGINGTGKSTLLKIIAGEEETDEGQVITQNGLRITYLPQMPDFPKGAIVQDYVADGKWQKDWSTQSEARNILNKLGITEHDALVEQLSGGQKKKVALARTLVNPSDVLILDEPTNHLDIYTRENLTEALMAYTGTLLMVTHDRHLMNSLGCPILYLEDGKATLYPSYDALMGRAAPAAAPEKAGDQPAKAGYGKEQRRRRAELRAKIKACEDEMEACGAREVELDNEINSPEVYNDPDLLRQKSDELSDLRFHQEELFAAWEKAMEEQEQYEQAAGEE